MRLTPGMCGKNTRQTTRYNAHAESADRNSDHPAEPSAMNVEPLPVGSAEDLLIVLQPEYARANEFRPIQARDPPYQGPHSRDGGGRPNLECQQEPGAVLGHSVACVHIGPHLRRHGVGRHQHLPHVAGPPRGRGPRQRSRALWSHSGRGLDRVHATVSGIQLSFEPSCQ